MHAHTEDDADRFPGRLGVAPSAHRYPLQGRKSGAGGDFGIPRVAGREGDEPRHQPGRNSIIFELKLKRDVFRLVLR